MDNKPMIEDTRYPYCGSPLTDADAYEDLRNATPQELLEAATWFLRQSASPPVEVEVAITYLREGFALACPGGWVHVAPMWLRESRKIAALDMKGE